MRDQNDSSIAKSKSQRKREMTALQKLGEDLVALTANELKQIPLPSALHEAVLGARAMRQREARRRQLQYIGRLMRDIDPAPIHAALADLRRRRHAGTAHFHELERWRERLLAQNGNALQDLLARFPHADLQRLRRLIRDAEKEQNNDQPPHAARKLFKYLRELSAASGNDTLPPES